MLETATPSEIYSELDEAALAQDETPPIQLAYEGLMRLVKTGTITHEDALLQHHRMFPSHRSGQ